MLTLLCAVFGTAWGDTVSFEVGTDISESNSITKNGITITFSNGTFNRTDNFRCYAGASMTITSTVGNMTQIDFTATSGNPMTNFSGNPDVGSWTDNTKTQWTGSASDINFGTTSTQVRITKIVVTYQNGTTPQKPNIATINSISPTTLTVGDTGTFTLGASYENNAYSVSWESLTPNLLSFEGATYQALSDGTAQVKVTVTPENTTDYNAVSATFDVTINPAPKTFPWSEDFSSGSLAGYSYKNGGSTTQIYQNDNLAGGSAPELLISKNDGTFSVTIDLKGHYGDMTLSFKSNKNNAIVVTTDPENLLGTEAISGKGPYVYTYSVTVSEGTSTLTLTFENTTSSNARFDDFMLEMASTKADPELSFETTTFNAETGSDFPAPTLTNPYSLDVTYSSSDETLATVVPETGEVTIGSEEGTVTITASFAGNDNYNPGSASYTITISQPELPDPGLKVTNAPGAMYVDEELPLTWESHSDGAVTFSSNNEDAIMVDEDGKLYAVEAGTSTITVTQAATASYKADEVSFTVTVIDESSSDKYVKVTNPNQLKVGNQYIIVVEESDGGSYAMGAQSGQIRSAEPAIISNNEVYTNNAVELTLGGKAGMWTLEAENGLLCLVNVPESGGKIESTNNVDATDMQKSWRIDEETFTASNRENPYWFIQFNYNEGNPRFACYRNTGQLNAACLYVKEPYETDENYHKDPLFSIKNIIVEMNDDTRQLNISTPSDGKNNIDFTFEDNSIVGIVNNNDGTYTLNPLTEGETTVVAILPQTTQYESAEATFTIKVVAEFDELASDVYQKITSIDELTNTINGEPCKYLFVYEDGSLVFDGSLESLDKANNGKEVTIIGDKIYCPDSYFIIDKEEGTIQSHSGFYIGRTSNANGLQTSKTTSYSNTISFDEDGNAVILSSGGAYLRYNAADNANRFRYYQSTTYTAQQPIQLYKAVVEKTFDFTISSQAKDGDDYYATIGDLGAGYFKVSGGVDVYTVVVDDGKLTFPIHFSDGDAIPGNGAYLVKGKAAGDYHFPATMAPDEEIDLGENMLHGTGEGNLTAEQMAAAGPTGPFDIDTKYYKLSLNKGKLGFYWGADGGAAFAYGKKHQAFLAVEPVGGNSGTQNISAYFFDDTTAISEVLSETATNGATYSISGVRMDGKQLPKGIYIVNGKKVVIK